MSNDYAMYPDEIERAEAAPRLKLKTYEELEAELDTFRDASLLLTGKLEDAEAELAELREEMTTRRKHAVKQIEVNDRILLKLATLREAAQAAFDCEMIPKSSASDGGASKYSEQVMVADRLRAALQEKGE